MTVVDVHPGPAEGPSCEEAQASLAQRLLWAMDRYRADGALNCPLVCWIDGPLDVAALEHALAVLAERHASLRTTFRRGRPPVQQVHPSPSAAGARLLVVDLSGESDPAGAVERALRAELDTRVEPEDWPIRTTLWRLRPERGLLCVNMHHLVCDLWSTTVLFEDLCALLAGARLPEPGRQYVDYARDEAAAEVSGAHGRHVQFWEQRLAGLHLVDVPMRPPSMQAMRRRASVETQVSEQTTRALLEVARTVGASPFAAAQAVLFAAVHRATGADDLAVASLFAQRSRPDLRRTVGCLVNLVVLRAAIPRGASYADAVRATHAAAVEAFIHQAVPFHALPRRAVPATARRVDEIVFHMTADEVPRSAAAGPLTLTMRIPDVVGRFDLEFAVMAAGDGLALKLNYSDARLTGDQARSLAAGYAAMADAVVSAPHAPITSLPVPSAALAGFSEVP